MNLKHGYTGTKLYEKWKGMLTRCYLKSWKDYKNYGGRGIGVCDEWQDFTNFKDWALNNRYDEDLWLERIDNDGDYEPSNCTFTTHLCQQRNKRNNKLNPLKVRAIRNLYKTTKLTQKEIGRMFNMGQGNINDIIHYRKWKGV